MKNIIRRNKINPLANFQVGFLTFDLQPFTEICIYRVSEGIAPLKLKAYPVFYHPYQSNARFPSLPSFKNRRYFGIDIAGSTPEGFVSNINWIAAWKCVKESEIIIFFGLQGGTALLVGLLGHLMRRTLISVNQTLPVVWERKRRWWVRFIKRGLLGLCSFHIWQNPAARDVLITVYGVPEDRLFSAPFEAGASLFKEILDKSRTNRRNIREILGLKDELIFLFAGTLHPFKGVLDLIQAISHLPRDARFACIFAGPEEPRNKKGGTIVYYMGFASKLGIDKKIRFLGQVPQDQLGALYLASDVVVLPTRKDCFPKVLLEGALASKPLITTNACGAAGILVINEKNGFVIEPGDIDSLVIAMEKLFNSDLRERMGKYSLEIAEQLPKAEDETKGFIDTIFRALELRAITA